MMSRTQKIASRVCLLSCSFGLGYKIPLRCRWAQLQKELKPTGLCGDARRFNSESLRNSVALCFPATRSPNHAAARFGRNSPDSIHTLSSVKSLIE